MQFIEGRLLSCRSLKKVSLSYLRHPQEGSHWERSVEGACSSTVHFFSMPLPFLLPLSEISGAAVTTFANLLIAAGRARKVHC